jgi:hypothetical protein
VNVRFVVAPRQALARLRRALDENGARADDAGPRALGHRQCFAQSRGMHPRERFVAVEMEQRRRGSEREHAHARCGDGVPGQRDRAVAPQFASRAAAGIGGDQRRAEIRFDPRGRLVRRVIARDEREVARGEEHAVARRGGDDLRAREVAELHGRRRVAIAVVAVFEGAAADEGEVDFVGGAGGGANDCARGAWWDWCFEIDADAVPVAREPESEGAASALHMKTRGA